MAGNMKRSDFIKLIGLGRVAFASGMAGVPGMLRCLAPSNL